MHTCACLGSRVGVGRFQSGGLRAARVTSNAGLSVHLICGHCDEAPDAAVHACCLQQDVCAVSVVHGEGQGVAEGIVHVCLQHRAEARCQDSVTCGISFERLLGCTAFYNTNFKAARVPIEQMQLS